MFEPGVAGSSVGGVRHPNATAPADVTDHSR